LTIGDGTCGYIVTPATERHAALIRARGAATGVAVS
jgi:hypothetical protein